MGYERLVDTSNEAVKQSWQGLFENDVAEFFVTEGMTFKKIASIFDVTVQDILSLNDINDQEKIYVGQKIIIKRQIINWQMILSLHLELLDLPLV